jgi:transcriptional regulator with XRE-family HTH domain
MKTRTLREARGARRLSLSELARRADVDKGTVSRLESGRITNPTTDTVAKLERALRIRRGSLVFGAAA